MRDKLDLVGGLDLQSTRIEIRQSMDSGSEYG